MNKEEIQALLEEVEELPPKAQKAYFWCAANLRLLTALFQNKKFLYKN